ncbi:beta strand repeat-containing protein [Acidiphilium multivorum]|uniref:beta strand repeat-containing protein n=1 Tax=Acidiphilium multivorum TaxID=62140 RepID=UPI001B8BBD42|nr:filamentous hemagglutinin N-terminal domain-containing protein [Acidiphilium multivorum]MBS3023460.1 filamentous hemagglutinin N-terminal domain-containing protein [Acidiphilium multivorum]
MKSPSAALRRHRLRQFALCSTALSVSLLAGSVAMAAAPAAGSLPGNFTVQNGGATGTNSYVLSSTSNTSATITVTPGTTATALDFNGAGTTKLAPSTGTSLPSGVTQNSGFSVGSGATVTITGDCTSPLLISDTTGNPSQIYGSVTNDGTGAMFVANQNGVVVGSTGSISTGAGLGLLGFAQSGSTFAGNGKIAVDTTTAGTGGVTIDSGATLRVDNATPHPPTDTVLVASNGAINVGANATAAGYNIISGYGVSGAASSGTVLTSGSSASVTLTAGSSSAPIEIASLVAAGNVSNSGVTDFTDGAAAGTPGVGKGTVAPIIGGAFSNTGVAYVGNDFKAASITNSGQLTDAGGMLTASGLSGATSGADITNTGVINETNVAGLTLVAGSDAGPIVNGNVSNTGVIDFTTAPTTVGLSVLASNIQMLGSVEQASGASTSAPLSASNQLPGFSLGTYRDSSGNVVGVVDYGTTIYAVAPKIDSQAVRIMSGGLYDSKSGDSAKITVGTGTATDPFAKNAKLAYNLSLFPKAMVQADTVDLIGFAPASGVGESSMNLDGVVSSQVAGGASDAINVINASNVNATSSGGFALNDGGSLDIQFSGNVNNPNGASAAGSSDFRYNYVPVAVANAAAGGAGTVNLYLDGPTNSTTTAQNVNILVGGNVAVTGSAATATLPTTTTPITPASSYVNNHLVLQATGNIDNGTYSTTTGKVSGADFYWPGLLYLNTVSSMSNPTQLSSSGAINVDAALSNILPAFSTGGTGIFLETNNLNLASGSTVTTSNNSWVNFASAKIASAFSLTQASNFFGGYKDTITPTVTELGLQQLPTADFQP